MKKEVVIIGHGYSSRLGVIRSLADLDCYITIIAIVFHRQVGRYLRFEGGKPIDCYSKYVDRVIYCHVKEDLISLLLKRCISHDQKVILIPDSDLSASLIDKNQERLKDYFVFPNINHCPGAVEYWMNKSLQKSLAQIIGLSVAEGQVVTIKDGRYVFPLITRYPCFTKPLVTNCGGKQFFKRCDNEEDLRCVLDYISRITDIDVLVEDFKDINAEYAVVGFSDSKEVVIPGVIEFVESSRSHKGIAREGIIKPIRGFEVFIGLLKEYVRTVGYYGLFDIDFYKSDGILYFCEMNLRFGGSGYAYTAMGINLPEMFVRSICGESIDKLKFKVTDEASFANERMCIDDWVAGAISKEEMLDIINKVNIRFVYNEIDNGPQRKLNRYIRGQAIKKLLKRWLGKRLKTG